MYCLPTGFELQLQYVLFSEPVSSCDAVAAFQADWIWIFLKRCTCHKSSLQLLPHFLETWKL